MSVVLPRVPSGGCVRAQWPHAEEANRGDGFSGEVDGDGCASSSRYDPGDQGGGDESFWDDPTVSVPGRYLIHVNEADGDEPKGSRLVVGRHRSALLLLGGPCPGPGDSFVRQPAPDGLFAVDEPGGDIHGCLSSLLGLLAPVLAEAYLAGSGEPASAHSVPIRSWAPFASARRYSCPLITVLDVT